jgi:tetratricopeptide (TPR) repeat protein
MEKVDVVIYGKSTPSPNFIPSLMNNIDYINEIIISEESPVKNLVRNLEAPVKVISEKSKNCAEEKNRLIACATTEYVFLLHTDFSPEEDLLEELLEETEEVQADIIYPNLILKEGEEEKIINYPELFNNEFTVLHGLAVEDCLPESAFLFKRELLEKVGEFNEYYDEFDFYEYIYRNVDSLKLKLASISYAVCEPSTNFIDTSYRSYALREVVLEKYDWKKDIFPFLSWQENPRIAKATAFTLIGNRLSAYYDYFNASEFYRKALLEFHNQETLKQLIKTYIEMGLFNEAEKLISKQQGMKDEEIERFSFYTEKLKSLIDELERAVEEGKIVEIVTALQEVTAFYSGAPIHNILGVIKWLENKKEEAFRFFYKAVTMNPINEDYLYNLSEVAKLLGKEGKVVDLVKRIVGTQE